MSPIQALGILHQPASRRLGDRYSGLAPAPEEGARRYPQEAVAD